MKHIPKNVERKLAEAAPSWIMGVTGAKQAGVFMLLTLDAFDDDPLLLYMALWYAYSNGVGVMMAPDSIAASAK